jgi:prepilin signal peptidase PulO-like enzyme (type II secretory pathway)
MKIDDATIKSFCHANAQVISQVTAPAFLLGAVGAFTSVLILRMNRIIDRSQASNAIKDDDLDQTKLKSDIPRLERRAKLLNKAILYSIISAIITSLPVIVAFVSAYFNVEHEHGVAALFVVALGFFTASLVHLALETRVTLHEYDHFSSS